MIHTEHFRTAGESIEVRHDNSGNVIWAHFKHGEYTLFPSLFSFLRYGEGDQEERIYVSEEEWNEICESGEYNFYNLPSKYEKVK
jgi:hypothetical protein